MAAKRNRRVNSSTLRKQLRYTVEEGSAVRDIGLKNGYLSERQAQLLKEKQAVRARRRMEIEQEEERQAALLEQEYRQRKAALLKKKKERILLARKKKEQAQLRMQRARTEAFLASEKPLSVGYMLFLTLVCALTVFLCVHFLQLRSQRTKQLTEIAVQQSALTKLKADNDALYRKLVSLESIEDIKEAAQKELGMHYASESQIRYYSIQDSGYVRQYTDVPKK